MVQPFPAENVVSGMEWLERERRMKPSLTSSGRSWEDLEGSQKLKLYSGALGRARLALHSLHAWKQERQNCHGLPEDSFQKATQDGPRE